MNTTSIFFPLSGDPLLRMRHTKISKRSILTWGIFPSRGFEMAMREGNKGIQCPKGKYVFEDIGHETWDLRMSQCRVGTIGTVWVSPGLRGEYGILYVIGHIESMDYTLSPSPSSTGWSLPLLQQRTWGPWRLRWYEDGWIPSSFPGFPWVCTTSLNIQPRGLLRDNVANGKGVKIL